MPAAKACFVAFDTETTGTEVGSRLVEIGAVAFSQRGKIVSTYETLVDPAMPIPADVSQVHGITDADVVDAPYVREAINDFLSWLPPGVTLLAHNAPYDQDILSLACSQARRRLPRLPLLDTLTMARQMGATAGNSLTTLVDAYGLPTPGPAHRALADAHAVYGYFQTVRGATPAIPSTLTSTWRHPRSLPPQLHNFPQALAEGQSWSCTYCGASGNPSRPTIIPYGYAEYQGAIHFHGYHTYWHQRRSFRDDRILSPALRH
ncbi:MAG: hypothetical protein EA401_13825 [Planctomycetota bacterium]|nr:MAG: hypothetical protein EA401_13825 [Planctomycetota bacterium]